ncbi:MAG: restriction endonuclease subunit R [Candidatus Parabeggiatoa sp. nov. 1]|nr:MAG: restriction endonuclease subunit R [Gammaproteobacteria bacterium]
MTDMIENPVINSPFEMPKRHFKFTDTGITNKIIKGRRESTYFIPIPKPKQQRNGQTAMDYQMQSRATPNDLINAIRKQVGIWRNKNYPHITQITRRLLEHWQAPAKEHKLFFCQIEALETIIYLTEAANKDKAGKNLLDDLALKNEQATPENCTVLNRLAGKMATGSGKTVVMSMVIAWQVLNKIAHPKSPRFTDKFLVVTPGITIRDRLRILLPNDAENYYHKLELVPNTYLQDLGRAKIVITNYHAFMLKDNIDAAKLTKNILGQSRNPDLFKETPGQMVRRVCGELGKEIIVINDEAHHCYHRKPIEEKSEKLTGDARKEAERNAQEARTWITGLEQIKNKLGLKAVYDLSATPFFLAGSGYGEGTLFPWVVSDFSLTDAIESGIVKVPRVPVDDNTINENPINRNLWQHIGKAFKGTRKSQETEFVYPQEFENALSTLYDNYHKAYNLWDKRRIDYPDSMPPVFIVVCNNTTTSKLVFDYIAGYEKDLPNGDKLLTKGKLPIFSNVQNGQWLERPNTVLIDSQQLESGEALSPEFKQLISTEIEELKAEIKQRYPGRSVDNITDEDLLREVMNTVGKKGKLGEHIKCVVSVSMLTEGWDINSVTHILGIRAFSSQLLCEQVVGRGLRRINYETEPHTVEVEGKMVKFEAFPAEYAEIYGVPFEFIPTAGGSPEPKPPKETTLVYTVDERADSLITFPHVIGYRHELIGECLIYQFDEGVQYILTSKDISTITENAPIAGESSLQSPDEIKNKRVSEIAFLLAQLILEKYFEQEGCDKGVHHVIGQAVQNKVKFWLFPQVLQITKHWMETYLICRDNTFPQLLWYEELKHNAANRIVQRLQTQAGQPILKPILPPRHTEGSTEDIDYRTSKPVYVTNHKCHLSHIVLDSKWERQFAQALQSMDEVAAYVKNHQLDFKIPYTFEGKQHHYLPDFIAKVDDGHEDFLNLIIEVSGEKLPDKDTKMETVKNLWIPAVNNSRQFGRWAVCEVTDPYQAMSTIRAYLNQPL